MTLTTKLVGLDAQRIIDSSESGLLGCDWAKSVLACLAVATLLLPSAVPQPWAEALRMLWLLVVKFVLQIAFDFNLCF